LVDESSQRIEYLSPTVGGKHHDKKLADDSELTLPSGTTVLKDKGFEGYIIPGACNCQPKKETAGSRINGIGKRDQFSDFGNTYRGRTRDSWNKTSRTFLGTRQRPLTIW